MTSALVVGAGWAGLACAVELVRAGMAVTVLEAGPEPGGRARRVRVDGRAVDNGQHLLLGAYHQTLDLMGTVGADPGRLFLRLPLELWVADGQAPPVHLRTPRLPAPLHLAAGLLSCRGLAAGERRAALGLALRAFVAGFRCDARLTVAGWVAGQPPRVRRTLWEPLCLAALNTPVERASAAVFLRVLGDAFGRRRADSDLLVPRADLGALLPRPAAAYLAARGAAVHTGRRVKAVHIAAGRAAGVTTRAGTEEARHVVLATAHHGAAALLGPLPGCAPLADALDRLGHQPICTVYLQYPGRVALDLPVIGLAGGTAQWLFDRRIDGRPGLMAAVISAQGPHMALGREALAARVAGELARHFPGWPAPQGRVVVRERRATFDCRAGSEQLRPGHRTPVAGLWLAGDYTRTPYPATLEGAVMSGLQCAREIISHHEGRR